MDISREDFMALVDQTWQVMFGEELESAEIHDAAGEIANILAGNLKSMLPQPSSLGLPWAEAIDLGRSLDSSENKPLSASWRWVKTQISVIVVCPSDASG